MPKGKGENDVPENPTIDALSSEDRKFPPPPEFAAQANCDESIYEEAKDLDSFWTKQAERVTWRKQWSQVLDWSDAPFAKWFVDATLNISESCLDQHLAERGDKVAYHWEGEPKATAGPSPTGSCTKRSARRPTPSPRSG